MGHYTMVLQSLEALEFSQSIELFHIDARLSIPAYGYVDSIGSDDYKINISDVKIVIKDDDYVEVSPARSPAINIKPICKPDINMITLSPYNFSAKLIDKTINYSIGLDWNTTAQIYNALGQVIYTIDSGNIKAGEYEFSLDLLDIPNGAYYFELNAIGLYRKVIGIVK
jgi:hypothetical protein